ncbi:50S ribosomal protein L11 methyltransferase [Sphingomonas jatrophae]|uniref:Ribosomal protein L11 methyltransferase n=1 Tax=Sphingomonas jatrophae TaxID=1166337 RepID=A0A1I6LDW4_9SPHN|nr:50S ribosomal protein L11 methyltransferase [Sphingomonas jatrophae]SFS01594.1 [LSU ribosomal protein L11P]-lysine N-methyltransferase [Sphingomonas jatrophae]
MSAEPRGDGVTGFPFDAPRDGSWKLTLPCTRAEADALAGDLPTLALLDPPPTLMTSEPDPDAPDAWRLDAYFEAEPDAASIRLIRDLVPSAAGTAPALEHVPEEDWVTLSQEGLAPIHAGRFWVHTPQHGADDAPAGSVRFAIAAGRAFGTGHHETTAGCLAMLDRLRRAGHHYGNIADVGTGTGLLAFAARSLWPSARIVASDIDPVSIEVTVENAAANAVPVGRARTAIELVVAAGLDHPRLKARAPYDLLIANILAGPLVELAPVFARALAPGGTLILAGLLQTQAEAVATAYRRQGLRLAEDARFGDWPTLRLVKRAARPARGRARKGVAVGMGSWSTDGAI